MITTFLTIIFYNVPTYVFFAMIISLCHIIIKNICIMIAQILTSKTVTSNIMLFRDPNLIKLVLNVVFEMYTFDAYGFTVYK